MSTPDTPLRWRALIVSTLLPTVLFSAGEGAIVPIIPTSATDLGAPLAFAGFIAALLLVGEVLGDIPSGLVVARFGERAAMIGSAALSIVGTMVAFAAPHPVVLAIGVLITGVTSAAFRLARHAFLTSVVPFAFRARALSTLGGTHRLGLLIGPFLTAGVLQFTHQARDAFLIHVALCVIVAAVLLAVRDPEALFGLRPGTPRTGALEVASEARGLFATLRSNARVLRTVGLGAASLAALRASRQVVLPLWAVSIGMPASLAAVIIGIAAVVDFALFYLGGSLMDRFGRVWVVVPSTAALATSHLLLASSALFPHPDWSFLGIAMLFAVSNGIGSGILMTLGADLAPRGEVAPFLGAWRFVNDTGSAVMPTLLAAVTAIASLPIACAVVGGIGIAGATVLRRTLPGALPARR